jgi:hypothetical protein
MSVNILLQDFIDMNLIDTNTAVPAGVWTRITGTATTDAHTTWHAAFRSVSGAKTFYIDGVQVEPGATASRYIETDGAAASRLAANIKPRRMFRLRAKYSSTTYPVFVAYARGFPQSYPALGFDSVVQVDLTDAFAILQGVDLVVGFTRDAELSGARIEAVLDAIGVPAALRDIDDGTVMVDAITVTSTGTSGLGHAKSVALDSEMGSLFVAKDGKVTFHQYDRRLNGSSLHSFTDTAGAALGYTAFETAFDDTYLWNYIRVTGAGGDESAQTAVDAASDAEHFTLTKTASTQLLTGSDVQQVADRYILRYANAEQRLPALQMNGAGDASSRWPVILDLEVSDRVTATRYADDTPTVLTQNVEGIRHQCAPGGPWTTTVPTSPADTNTYLELDDATFGELDDIYMLA